MRIPGLLLLKTFRNPRISTFLVSFLDCNLISHGGPEFLVGSFSLNLEENDVNPSPKEVKEHDSDEDWDAELEIDPSERLSTIQTGLLDRKVCIKC
jgi:hypothetical protein